MAPEPRDDGNFISRERKILYSSSIGHIHTERHEPEHMNTGDSLVPQSSPLGRLDTPTRGFTHTPLWIRNAYSGIARAVLLSQKIDEKEKTKRNSARVTSCRLVPRHFSRIKNHESADHIDRSKSSIFFCRLSSLFPLLGRWDFAFFLLNHVEDRRQFENSWFLRFYPLFRVIWGKMAHRSVLNRLRSFRREKNVARQRPRVCTPLRLNESTRQCPIVCVAKAHKLDIFISCVLL